MRYVTVTLHPSVDRIAEVGGPGGPPLGPSRDVPAGKGVNTARVLRRIAEPGEEVHAFAWIGRDRAAWFRRHLAAEGVAFHASLRDARTRVCETFLWSGGEDHDRTDMAPPAPGEVDRLLRALARLPVDGAAVAVCGSAPPRTPPEVLGQVLSTLRSRAAILVVDGGPPWLEAGRHLLLTGLKGNAAEVGSWLGIGDDVDPGRAAHRDALARVVLHPAGPGALLVTRGSRGALLATREHLLSAPAPRPLDTPRMATGCGDAATAGWLVALAAGWDPGEMLRMAIATGTAKLSVPDPGG